MKPYKDNKRTAVLFFLIILITSALFPCIAGAGILEPPGHAVSPPGTPGASFAHHPSRHLWVAADFDPVKGRATVFRGRFPTASSEHSTAAKDFLSEYAQLFGIKPDLGDLRLFHRVDDIGGAVLVYEQEYKGIPVFGGSILVGFDTKGEIIHVKSNYVPDLKLSNIPGIDTDRAVSIAETELGAVFQETPDIRLVIVEGDKDWYGHYLAYQVSGFLTNPLGRWEVFVDARSGNVVRVINRLKETGPACTACDPLSDNECASVFFHNPVVELDDTSLRDSNNVDSALVSCKLYNLTSSTNLTGNYADTSITVARVGPPYSFLRSDADVGGGITGQQAVDETIAYYHATRSKHYLNDLGFPGVMNYPIDIDAHDASVGDNAYYDPAVKELHFGEGGIDDGQDPDIVYHEYGHAMQDDQVPGFGLTHEGGSMGEGFGDYWAAALLDSKAAADLGLACVGSWDAVEWNPYNGGFGSGCLRRLDYLWEYPEDLRWEVHDDGEIWSAALWSLRNAVGAGIADSLVVKSHTFLSTTATFIDGADALLSADSALYGSAYTSNINSVMKDYGIPRTGIPADSTGLDLFVDFVCESNHRYVNEEYRECAFTQPGADRVMIHFSRLDTESGYDFVYISDGDFNQVQALSGAPFGKKQDPGFSSAVSGDTIIARFKSDNVIRGWGFRTDRIYYSISDPNDVDDDLDGYTENEGDCDDTNPDINPGEAEVCDGIDNNCNDQTDEGLTTTYYRDFDSDTYGDPATTTDECSLPVGYVMNNTDCDDTDSNIWPGGPPVRVSGETPAYYQTLQQAYDNPLDDKTIEAKNESLNNDLNIDKAKTVIFIGGYDCGYASVTGHTTLNGVMTVTAGSISVENLILH